MSRCDHQCDVARFRVVLPDGCVVVGPIQGSGGKLGDGARHAGPVRQRIDALVRLLRAQRLAEDGADSGLYEPRPGHVACYPHYSAAEDGEPVIVPLVGSRFAVLTEGER